MIKTLIGTSRPSSNTYTSKNNDSSFGLQAVRIQKELEEQTLREVLKELNQFEKPLTRSRRVEEPAINKTFKKNNNSKYKHVKSSGYGTANWSPVRLKSPSNRASESLQSSKSYLSIEVDDPQIKTQKNDTLEFKKRINSLINDREHDKNALNELKGKKTTLE